MHGSSRAALRAYAVAAIGTVALAAPATAAANRHHGDHHRAPSLSAPIATNLAGPLQLAVDRHSIYVSQAFAGLLTNIRPGGARTDVATNPGGEIAGVDVGRRHEIFYTSSTSDETTGMVTAAALNRLRDGTSTVVRDLLEFEQTHNVDQKNHYGFQSIDAACAAQLPPDIGPPQYTGQIDAHPYSVAVSGRHHYVADAAANAIYDVSSSGHVRVVRVLPPQPAVITAEAATANGLPACTVGLTYNFEPVPTDVEVGRHGTLYVTTLPGGVEDASLGARGSVYSINPRTRKARKIATGFLGATNLALGRHGEIYVAEIFANKVSRVVHGGPRTVVDLPTPAALEYANGKLYVGYDVFGPEGQPPNGKVATIRVGGHHHGHHSRRAAHFPRTRAAAQQLARLMHL
jgi:hypothetical protein